MSDWLPVFAGTGSAAAGGFYLAFSAVVMPALRRQPAKDAITTMVSINEKAVRPPFMILFFGTAAACAAVAVIAATDALTHSPFRVAGAAAYLAGWASTVLVNVPLNNRLSRRGGGQPDRHWHSFQRSWIPANHVRAALSIAGAVGLLVPT
ncbi:DUF1772 domain-containing protein [Cryobacterium adonitolivorans]|uniref:anthrone oxygenase family protein n=1 Tax=Cryobacterium adonitolivorans TaxID=1259189 RepID=UPI001F5414CF|nr:anthrone oxygenase family protein [Cryobacterium adonitolivorans]